MAKKNKSKKLTVKERKKELEKNKPEEVKEEKTVNIKLSKEEKKKEKQRKKEAKKAEKEKAKIAKKSERAVVGKGTMRQELKKVTWPTGSELVKSTSAVIFIVILTALIIFVSDLIFGALNKQFSKQVQRNKYKIEEKEKTDNTENKEEEKKEENKENTSKEADK